MYKWHSCETHPLGIIIAMQQKVGYLKSTVPLMNEDKKNKQPQQGERPGNENQGGASSSEGQEGNRESGSSNS